MTFLGTCCRDQQEKHNSSLASTISATQKKKRNTPKVLSIAFLVLFATVLSMALSTVSAQINSGQANVKLELLTLSNRILPGGSVGQQAVTQGATLAIGSKVGLRVSSNSNSYVYIFNYDAAGSLNTLSNPATNFMRGGESRIYPNNHSLYEVSGPGGLESIFAIASNAPLQAARLQQLQAQHIQHMQSIQSRQSINGRNYSSQARALMNDSSHGMAGNSNVQDGWLTDSIIFNVVNTANGSPVTQAPVTQAPVTQAPALSNYSPSRPVPNNPPVNSTVTASNLSGIGNGYQNCTLSGLNLSAPTSSVGFRQRCINKSFDGSFESQATMQDVVVHFGTELVNKGFSYQATTKGDLHDFRATFGYQGKSFEMQVEKSGQYYRFQLIEFNPKANKY